MPSDRRDMITGNMDSYTSIQCHKRSRYNQHEERRMSDIQCTSLLPSPCHNTKTSPPTTPWSGWKVLSAETSPCSVKGNGEFPPLIAKDEVDFWLTPEIKNWADFMDEEEETKSQEDNKPKANTPNAKKQGFKRKLLLSESGGRSSQPRKSHKPILTDEHRLAQRQKQIDYGKNTTSYDRYLGQRPRDLREQGDPRTPDKFQICSTRSWTGQVKSWRRRLHEWDLPTERNVDPFALTSNNSDVLVDVDMRKYENGGSCGSVSPSISNEDLANLSLDTNSLKENLPL